MTQEALRLALEAMESVTVECNNFHHPKKDQNHHWAKCPPVARWNKAIIVIKEALTQPEQEPLAYSGNGTAGREADVRPTGFFFQMPKRQWVGLTDEELSKFDVDPIEAKLMIAKLKEKNT